MLQNASPEETAVVLFPQPMGLARLIAPPPSRRPRPCARAGKPAKDGLAAAARMGRLATRHGAALAVTGGGGMLLFSEAPMDAPRRVFLLIQLSGDWYWRLDIMRDDGLIGPFVSRDEAEKDAKETLGIKEGGPGG
jgi:hypothetical protein